jgi:hypothetical protein
VRRVTGRQPLDHAGVVSHYVQDHRIELFGLKHLGTP